MKLFTGDKASLQKLATEVDKRMGYPKPGVRLGPGLYTSTPVTTTKWSDVAQVGAEWTYQTEGLPDAVKTQAVATAAVSVVEKDLDDQGVVRELAAEIKK